MCVSSHALHAYVCVVGEGGNCDREAEQSQPQSKALQQWVACRFAVTVAARVYIHQHHHLPGLVRQWLPNGIYLTCFYHLSCCNHTCDPSPCTDILSLTPPFLPVRSPHHPCTQPNTPSGGRTLPTAPFLQPSKTASFRTSRLLRPSLPSQTPSQVLRSVLPCRPSPC